MSRNRSNPEHNLVRLPLVEELIKLGWDPRQITVTPEWRIPKTPSAAAKREAGESFDAFPADIAVFDSAEHLGDYRHLLFIVETKAPEVQSGKTQLEILLSLERYAKLGIWTNGADRVFLYRAADGTLFEERRKKLPHPKESLMRGAPAPLTYEQLNIPTLAELRSTLSQLLNVIVARDGKSSRRDDQLGQLCNLILTKLESDKAGMNDPQSPVMFQFTVDERKTAATIQRYFTDLRATHSDIFANDPIHHIHLDDQTIAEAVYSLSSFRLFDVQLSLVSEAFQIFRTASLKSEEGQYFTPHAVIESAVRFMGINQWDNVIDPACGTGGFLFETYNQLKRNYPSMTDAQAKGWAMRHLYGIDKDSINAKLTKSLMIAIGDGSTNTYNADSLRVSTWTAKYPRILGKVEDGSFSCVITNPPFGKNLTFSRNDGQLERYDICKVPEKRFDSISLSTNNYEERELGIVFLERAYQLLRAGGKLGIILPETYFFSPSYAWLQGWLWKRFRLIGILNIPMEAFQGFCRAKTNFYAFQKLSDEGSENERQSALPPWFQEGKTLIVNAPTCGINKDGEEQYIVDPITGERSDTIDNKLLEAIDAIEKSKSSPFFRSLDESEIRDKVILVPYYYDDSYDKKFNVFLRSDKELSSSTLGDLAASAFLTIQPGHGSPSQDQRVGDVPYVKVSDLRAGLININPTNMIPIGLATQYWNASRKIASSGLMAYDLISPERASKNIGEFCVLLPGQEQIVLTKEVIIIRATATAPFDQFFLMWALSLTVVRDQWRRIVFFQTNREDVGRRVLEIRIPIAKTEKHAKAVAKPFKEYFHSLQAARENLENGMTKSGYEHHIFFS